MTRILAIELTKIGLTFVQRPGIRIFHEGIDLGIGLEPDIIIENKVIIELKSVETLAPVHFKQLLSYLRATNLKLGLLINFNVPLIKDGIHRVVSSL